MVGWDETCAIGNGILLKIDWDWPSAAWRVVNGVIDVVLIGVKDDVAQKSRVIKDRKRFMLLLIPWND